MSILTPAFNEEDHLEEMIASVRSQTHDDWELVLVDDGSSDSTREIIRTFAAVDPRIVDATPGGKLGKNRAFNAAFLRSTGSLVVIAGADDTLPHDSLSKRVEWASQAQHSRFVAYFKFRTFSNIPRYNGQVLPRGAACSRSAATLSLSRDLAAEIFPIDENLPAEDVYIGRAADYLADEVILQPTVVYNYRIHQGNSNPRHLDFPAFNESMHRRQLAFRSLLASDLALPSTARTDFEERAQVEVWRYSGHTLAVLMRSNLPLIERLAIASASRPSLRRLRLSLNKVVSGRRGR